MPSRSVVFDLDGVLVDSEPYWQTAFARVGNAYAISEGLRDPGLVAEDMAAYQGGRVNDTMRSVAQGLGLAPDRVTVDWLAEEVILDAGAAFARNPREIKASVDVLRDLASAGVALAVASSSAQSFIDVALDAIGVGELVEVRESAFDLAEGKPHPEVYLNALAGLGVTTSRAIAVEDSTTGVRSAVAAGLRTVWLRSGTYDEALSSLREADPHLGPAAVDRVWLVEERLSIDAVWSTLDDPAR